MRLEASSILQPNIADIATLHMEFPSALNAHVSVSWLHPFKEQIVVIGEDAMIVFDDTEPWSKKLSPYKHRVRLSKSLPELKKSEVIYNNVQESEPLKNECQHFVDVAGEHKADYKWRRGAESFEGSCKA